MTNATVKKFYLNKRMVKKIPTALLFSICLVSVATVPPIFSRRVCVPVSNTANVYLGKKNDSRTVSSKSLLPCFLRVVRVYSR